jgi:ribosomal protein L5
MHYQSLSLIFDNTIKIPHLKSNNAPKIEAIKLNISISKNMLHTLGNLLNIFNIRPKIKIARKSLSAFKIRKNMEIGACLTLRRVSLYNIINILHFNLPLISPEKITPLFGLSNLKKLALSSSQNFTSGANIQYIFSGANISIAHNLILSSFNYGSKVE